MKRILKITGIALGGLFVLLLILAAFFYQRTSSRMDQRFDIQPVLTSVVADSATIARGEHVMEIEACRHCHGEDLAGAVMMDMPLWRMVAPNLTPGRGGVGQSFQVADWDRAIRSGVGQDGRKLMIMPSDVYQNLSNQDAAALVAYLQQIGSVENELPETEFRFLGNLMLGAGNFDPADEIYPAGVGRQMTPAHEPTEELGEYLASTACIGCHGEDLGGKEPDSRACPPALNLAASGAWELGEFITTMRTGVNPEGRQLDEKCMPWESFKEMTDIELEGLHRFIETETATGK